MIEDTEYTVEVIQYLRPDGRKKRQEAPVIKEYYDKAQEAISLGAFFEAEVLTTGLVSLIGCMILDGEPHDVAIEICSNGPEVQEAFNKVIDRTLEKAKGVSC